MEGKLEPQVELWIALSHGPASYGSEAVAAVQKQFVSSTCKADLNFYHTKERTP